MISLNEWVVIEREDKTLALAKVGVSTIKSLRFAVDSIDLVGAPYGSTFEIVHDPSNNNNSSSSNNNKKYRAKRVTATTNSTSLDSDEILTTQSPSPTPPPIPIITTTSTTLANPHGSTNIRNNSQLNDRATNQRLDSDGIKRLRVDGKSGEEIVAALVEHSETFALKTSYSQEKYIQKLKSKHVARFTVFKCTSRSIAEVQFLKNIPTKHEDKLRRIRWCDTLPVILAYANIHASSRVLLLDGVGGIVALSVLERLDDSNGRMIYLQSRAGEEKNYGPPMSHFLNLSHESIASRVINIPIGWLPGVVEPRYPLANHYVKEFPTTSTTNNSSSNTSSNSSSSSNSETIIDPTFAIRTQLYALRNTRQEEIISLLDHGGPGADSLIIASPHPPIEAFRTLFPFLRMGQPFVVHSPTIEPLMACREYALSTGMTTFVTVMETWCREYQTLEQRSHPLMTGSATGGFILRGYKTGKKSEGVGSGSIVNSPELVLSEPEENEQDDE
jgi:tRNA (adenine-N(1)-)-methyltransferase non-catalytic subunit